MIIYFVRQIPREYKPMRRIHEEKRTNYRAGFFAPTATSPNHCFLIHNDFPRDENPPKQQIVNN